MSYILCFEDESNKESENKSQTKETIYEQKSISKANNNYYCSNLSNYRHNFKFKCF